jgi:uncharacterized membrane protein
MDIESLLIGLGLLLVSLLLFRYVRRIKPSSTSNHWEEQSQNVYIGIWGVIIMCVMGALVCILKALPAQI